MQFFILNSNQKYAGYLGATDAEDDQVLLFEPPKDPAWKAPRLVEYLGDPPTRPKRRGDYHSSGRAHYFSERAIDALRPFLEASGIWLPVEIEDRPEKFFRFWLTRNVDCLDLDCSVTVHIKPIPGSTGVIRKPVFRETAWDGSDVFRVPGDPNIKCFVTAKFVEACRAAKINGMEFDREAFDPDPICI